MQDQHCRGYPHGGRLRTLSRIGKLRINNSSLSLQLESHVVGSGLFLAPYRNPENVEFANDWIS